MTAWTNDDSELAKFCESEPIHVPGSVQSRGVLFACPLDSWTISHASENAPDFFGLAARDVIGAQLKTVIGETLQRRIANLPRTNLDGAPSPGRLFRVKSSTGRFVNVSVHIFAGRRIIEFEPLPKAKPEEPLDLVRMLLPGLQKSRSLNELCQTAAAELRKIISYDRVMIYRFLQDGSGEVIAEDRDEALEPYLGLRYPASDIPPQARELYSKNWVRLISDVSSPPVPIWANSPDAEPLDLSFADLRSVSPVHILYLKNMGVGASMSISIMVGGELWGLIACHHRTARDVPAQLRLAAELLGQVFSLQIQSVKGVEAYVTLRTTRAYLDRVAAEFPAGGDLSDLEDQLQGLASLVTGDGAGLWIDERWIGKGQLPEAKEVALLVRFLRDRNAEEVFATHKLCDSFKLAATWSCELKGLMAIPLSTRGDWLFIFRKEAARVVTWGGSRDKFVSIDSATGRLQPRTSFAAWTETVRGESLPFSSRERLIGDTVRLYLRDIIVRFGDAFAEARRQAELKQRLSNNAYHVRVRSTLELIRSLVEAPSDAGKAVKDYVRVLDSRIRAAMLAHEAAVISNSGCDLLELAENSLAAAGEGSAIVPEIAGSSVPLDPKAYTVLAVVFNELVSLSEANGVLGSAEGTIVLNWSADPSAGLMISWKESCFLPTGATKPGEPSIALVKRCIEQGLGGEAAVRFDARGLQANLVIPPRYVQRRRRGIGVEEQGFVEAYSRSLEGYVVLVVDTDSAACDQLEAILRERGASIVLKVETAELAPERLAVVQPDIAILDLDYQANETLSIAAMLQEQDIPFLFAAAGDRHMLPERYAGIRVVPKPYCADTLPGVMQDTLLPHMIRAVLQSGVDPGQAGA